MAMTDDARDAQAALAARTDGSRAQESHRAFGRIYDRHSAVVRALCVRHLPNETEADDALQETFLRAFRLLHELSDGDGLRSWLYAIARNVCAERRRSAARRNKHEQNAATEQIVMSGLTSSNHTVDARRREPDGGECAERSETLERLSAALDELPDDERLAIHLYYLEPDPVVAAGSTLGISRSGFYKLLARAREHLGLKLGSVAP